MAQDNDNTVEKQPKPKMPDDFDSEESFVSYVRKCYSDDTGYDQTNREEAVLDARFAAGDQWDSRILQERMSKNKPALTINRLTAFVAQVIGNRRLNETDIKVIPDYSGDKDEARIREGLIRNIQKNSAAKRAYDAAFQNQVIGGLGSFQVVLDYASDDVFDQDIKIEPIHDETSVAWDLASFDPTGADARHVTVCEYVSHKDFEKMWPGKATANFQADGVGTQYRANMDGWYEKDRVRVADFWRIRSRKRTLALMQDGKTIDVTDLDPEDYLDQVAVRADMQPVMRETRVKYAEMYKVSGNDVLEGPYTLPIKRVPVFRVPAWEINIGTGRTRFGLVRHLRDPMRIHNYMESVKIEKLMLSPKAKWLAGKTAVEGYEDAFRRAHLSDDPLLTWNDEESANKPEYVRPNDMEVALIQASQESVQMIKDVSNLHEASLGQTSNEVSGKAIMARQRVGETGTVIYQDNMDAAMEEAGRVINDLIPYVYDTPRVVKVLGADDEINFETVKINYGDEDSIDITTNKYNVSITTGPSTATKRIESAEFTQSAVNANPALLEVAGDLIFEAMDVAGANKIANRIRSKMDPGVLGEDITPEQQQQAQEQAQKQQAAEQLAIRAQTADISAKEAQAQNALAQAARAKAEAMRAMGEAGLAPEKMRAEIEKIYAEIASQETRDALQAVDAFTGENNVSE